MTTLTINGKEYTAECSFKFSKLADKKYSRKKNDSDPDNGFHTVFGGLIDFENDFLVAFWDCAINEPSKTKPSIEDIEQALDERFRADGTTEKAFKEAYTEIDESYFFGKKVQKYWSNIEMIKNFGKTDEEKEQNKMAYDRMKQAKAEIEA